MREKEKERAEVIYGIYRWIAVEGKREQEKHERLDWVV